MKDFSKLQFVSIVLAAGTFVLVAVLQTPATVVCFVAGCGLVGFVAYLERRRIDELEKFKGEVRAELQKLQDEFQGLMLSKGLRK